MTDKQGSDTLLMVFTIFRHGARGPLIFVPNDKNQEHWGNQLGFLTNEGKQQAYKLGLWYRQRYDNFLSKNYNSNDIYVYSTDTNRTLMTAQCVLAGLYPPVGPNQWHDSMQWQPIPVHTNSGDTDPHQATLNPFSVETFTIEHCKTDRHLDMLKNFLQNKPTYEKWFHHFYGKMQMRLDYLLYSLEGAHINQMNGLPIEIPPGIENFPALCSAFIQDLQFGCEIFPYYSKLGSSMLNEVSKAINENIKNKNPTKMYMYSMHDLNLIGVFAQLNINRPRTQYCGFLTFELHKLADGKHYIKLQHQIKYDSDLSDLSIVDNQLYCPWEQFENIVETCRKTCNLLV